ncbi:molybdopterin-dependent oxidoreductase [Thermodesulfobacteriota bacterium]
MMAEKDGIERIHTYCINCAALCGVIAYLRNGFLVKVEGDPDSLNNAGTLCPKGLSAKQMIYHPERLKYPMKRTRPKGDDDPGWVRITWDEAFDTIAANMQEIKEQYGPEAFFFQKGSTGGSSGSEWYSFFNRLSNIYGSPNFGGTGHICCYTRSCPGLPLILGNNGLRPSIDYEKTNCMVIVGFNIFHTQPNIARKILDAQARGAKLIVVDTLLSPTASRADIWLGIRPGTDMALFLAMHHVIVKERLYDVDFLKNWTNAPFLVRDDNGLFLRADDGQRYLVWDVNTSTCVAADPWTSPEVKPAINGSYRVNNLACRPAWQLFCDLVEPCTPEWAQEITWVPEERIREVAGIIATVKPTSIDWFNGLMRNSNTFYTGVALGLLPVVTGNWDVRGGLTYAVRSKLSTPKSTQYLPRDWMKKSLVAQAGFKVTALDEKQVGPMSLVAEAMLTDKPYPIKGMLSLASGIGTSNPNSQKMLDAVRKLKFCAMGDMWKTPAMVMADIVLPCTTPWESEYVGYNPPYLMHRRPLVQPRYEAKTDLVIVFELACRLGYGEMFWGGDITKAFNELLLPFGVTVDDLDANPRGMYLSPPEPKERKYATKDKETGKYQGFGTPTGRIEIYSEKLKTLGYDPLPYWREPEPGPVSTPELFREFPLMLSFLPRPMQWTHGQFRIVPWLRECQPEPVVWINRRTAATLAIHEGDPVLVETPKRDGTLQGYLRLKAHLTESVHPQSISVPYGWWQGCESLGLKESGILDGSANVNSLIDDSYRDPVSGTIGMGSYPCRIKKE